MGGTKRKSPLWDEIENKNGNRKCSLMNLNDGSVNMKMEPSNDQSQSLKWLQNVTHRHLCHQCHLHYNACARDFPWVQLIFCFVRPGSSSLNYFVLDCRVRMLIPFTNTSDTYIKYILCETKMCIWMIDSVQVKLSRVGDWRLRRYHQVQLGHVGKLAMYGTKKTSSYYVTAGDMYVHKQWRATTAWSLLSICHPLLDGIISLALFIQPTKRQRDGGVEKCVCARPSKT